MSVPRSRRERLPWFPTLNSDVCLADLECLNFCPADVFDWDPATGKPVVARPFDCIPGCRSCAEMCKGKGISLPGKKEVAAALKRIRAEDGLLSERGKRRRARAEEGTPFMRVKGQEWGRAKPQGSRKKVAKGSKRKARNPGNLSATKPAPCATKPAK